MKYNFYYLIEFKIILENLLIKECLFLIILITIKLFINCRKYVFYNFKALKFWLDKL
jgi:hypothetical protein